MQFYLGSKLLVHHLVKDVNSSTKRKNRVSTTVKGKTYKIKNLWLNFTNW